MEDREEMQQLAGRNMGFPNMKYLDPEVNGPPV